MKKVGIMGGTFNPIHNAHLILAEQANYQFELDKVLFMPTKNPPHKNRREIASDEHRKNMIMVAIKDNPQFELSTLELDRDGITYTAETLRTLHQLEPNTQYYFILGQDSLMSMTRWKQPETICSLATIVAATRDGFVEEEFEQQCLLLHQMYGANILRLSMPTIALSSTAIRRRCKAKEPIRYYMPETVFSYINEHKLYL